MDLVARGPSASVPGKPLSPASLVVIVDETKSSSRLTVGAESKGSAPRLLPAIMLLTSTVVSARTLVPEHLLLPRMCYTMQFMSEMRSE